MKYEELNDLAFDLYSICHRYVKFINCNRETQRVSPRQLTSTPAQALQALHGSQNSGGRGRSPASNNMITSNINSDGLPNFNHENSNASSNMVAAASAALSAAAALDPLLQVRL